MNCQLLLLVLVLVCWVAGCGGPGQSDAAAQPDLSASSAVEGELGGCPGSGKSGVAEAAAGKPKQAASAPAQADAQQAGWPKDYRVFRTNDTANWPAYELPEEIRFKMPQVPDRVIKPSPPISGP